MGSPSSVDGSTASVAVRHRPAADRYPAGYPVYETMLNSDSRWALNEGGRHFERDSLVFQAMRRIAQRLGDLNIPYAVVGGMALFQHGLRRFTEDVDILVTKRDLKLIHDKLEGLGYLPPFRNSKNLRDTELGVKIEFLIAGDYPGDGLAKPVSFPDPAGVGIEDNGIKFVGLETLIELKLASGMTNPGRMKDLSDVLELIKVLSLPQDFATRLNPFVGDEYKKLWRQAKKRYVMLWRNKWLTSDAKSLDEMVAALRSAADELERMRKDGVALENDGGVADDYAHLVTSDPLVAERYGLIDESEYWDAADDGDDDTQDGTT